MDKEPHLQLPDLEDVTIQDEMKVYARWIGLLNRSGVDYVLGGAFAFYAHTGIWRNTKDLDAFLRPEGLKTVLDRMQAAGFETEITDPVWLAKVRNRPYCLDLIFGLANRQSRMDLGFFRCALRCSVLGISACIMPVEELIATKAFVVKSYRFDGADILHLIRSAAGAIDWQRLLALFGEHGDLLLWYLVLFNFVYPDGLNYVPPDLIRKLYTDAEARWKNRGPAGHFKGTLLDPASFKIDCKRWGYADIHERPALVKTGGEAL